MKAWVKKVYGYGVASFFADFSHEMTIALIPTIVAQFTGSTQLPLVLGIIASIGDAFASFMRIISGYLTDRLSRKKPLIMFGYALAAVFTTLIGFAHSIWGVLSYRILAFVGSGVREPPRDAMIATLVEPTDYGRSFGLRNAMDTLGSLVGPLVAFACIGYFSIKSIFVLSFIPGVLSVIAILFLTQDLKISKKPMHIPPTFWQDLRSLPRSFLIFLAIVFILDLATFNKLLLLARTKEMLGLNEVAAAQVVVLLYALFNVVRAIGEFSIGFLSDYINRLFLLATLGCGVLAITAYLLINSHGSITYCALIFILSGISTAASFTLKKACAADLLPANLRGIGYGVLQAGEGFGMLFSSAIIGFLWTSYSATLGFSYSIVLSLGASVLLLGLWMRQISKK